VSGSTVYIGGTFAQVGGQARSNIAAIDATTGVPTSFAPDANLTVSALAVSGSTVYAGGNFGVIGGATRIGLAALDATTGAALSGWDAGADGNVYCLELSGTKLYAGGSFTHIGGAPRNYMTELDAATGTATAWDANADGAAQVFKVSGSTVYVGGIFGNVGGQARNNIAQLDATGTATSWNPNCDGAVDALALSGSSVFAGGFFGNIGGASHKNIAELDATGSATSWDPVASDGILALAVGPMALYAGGVFLSTGVEPQSYIAAFSDVSTAITLATMSAESDASGIHILWYAPGDNIATTSVYRRTDGTDWVLLAHPQPDAARNIVYDDNSVTPGTRYGYKLVVRDFQGAETSAEAWVTAAEGVGAPRVVVLSPVHPNPFRVGGQLTYGLPHAGRVRLSVHDLRGRLVAMVVDRTEPAGWRSMTWDGRDGAGHQVASGAYFARLEMDGDVLVRKMVVVR
jgi:hypothetical protein